MAITLTKAVKLDTMHCLEWMRDNDYKYDRDAKFVHSLIFNSGEKVSFGIVNDTLVKVLRTIHATMWRLEMKRSYNKLKEQMAAYQ